MANDPTPAPARLSRRKLPLYLIPFVLGLAGLLFSSQLPDLFLRAVVVVLSVAVPLFAGGAMLSRPQMGVVQRLLMLGGVLLLLIGAAVSVSGFSEQLVEREYLSEFAGMLSRTVGLGSLLLGLFVVLYAVVRSREDVDEYADRFRHLASHISDGFILTALDGTILMANKQFFEMAGLTEDQLIGQRAPDVAERLGLHDLVPQFEFERPGEQTEFEVDFRVRGEERRFWFRGAPLFDRTGRETGVLATVRDVTEYHRLSRRVERYAESLQDLVEEQTRKLRASEERFRQLLVSMREGFITLDASYRIRFANRSLLALLQLPEASLVGREIFDFVDAPGRMGLLNLLAQGRELRAADARRDVNLLAADGSSVPVLVGVAFVGESDNSLSRYSLVTTSVTELKAMQSQLEERARELERANEQLMQHDRAKDSFLSNVSHELRTPLSTIQGYLEMMESGSLGTLAAEQEAAVQVMHRNVRRLIGHINEIIDFSRMEIRGVQLNIDLFSPETLARHALDSARPQAEAGGVRLTCEAAPEVPAWAWGDGEKLGQVLGVLLNNAVKFTETGGEVRVRLGLSAANRLTLAVQDTGIGIDPRYHESVFTKFFQVDASRTRRFSGTGIGLSIARSIVQAHGGDITLDSEPGAGSCFTVVLPDATYEAEVDASEPLLDGTRLLIVDASERLAHASAQLLEAAGMAWDRARDAYEVTGGAKP